METPAKPYHSAFNFGLAAAMILLAGCAAPSDGPRPPFGYPGAVGEEVPFEAGTLVPGEDESFELAADGVTRIALLLPLSGSSAELGEAMLNAAELALFDVGDPRLEIIPRDTRGSPDGARQAVAAAIEAGADLILGPLFSGSVSAAGPAARAYGIPMIAFSTDRTVAGDGVYLLGFMPGQQVRRIIAYARSQGIENFAALVPDSAYGHAVLQTFGGAVLDVGGNITGIELYAQETAALMDPVRKLGNYDNRRNSLLDERRSLEALGEDDSLARELLDSLEVLETLGAVDFDAVFIPEGGALLRALAPLLPYYEIDPNKIRFLGTGLWDDPPLSREPALIGSWFAGPPPNAGATLSKRFHAVFDREPPRIASLAYDAVALAAVLSRRRRSDRFSRQRLSDPNGFVGLDGIFRFLDTGITERGLAIVEVRRSGFAVISPAPTSFQLPIN